MALLKDSKDREEFLKSKLANFVSLNIEYKENKINNVEASTVGDFLDVYVDGSCSDNGKDGWGGFGLVAEVRNGSKRTVLCEQWGHLAETTSARAEVIALYQGLRFLKDKEFKKAFIYTDSQYVANTINLGWLEGWEKNNYKKKMHADVWRKIYYMYNNLRDKLDIEWVKGHDACHGNLHADKLAERGKNMNEQKSDNA